MPTYQESTRRDCNNLPVCRRLLLAASDLKLPSRLKREVCKQFKMEDCGEPGVCLGFEIHREIEEKTLPEPVTIRQEGPRTIRYAQFETRCLSHGGTADRGRY